MVCCFLDSSPLCWQCYASAEKDVLRFFTVPKPLVTVSLPAWHLPWRYSPVVYTEKAEIPDLFLPLSPMCSVNLSLFLQPPWAAWGLARWLWGCQSAHSYQPPNELWHGLARREDWDSRTCSYILNDLGNQTRILPFTPDQLSSQNVAALVSSRLAYIVLIN